MKKTDVRNALLKGLTEEESAALFEYFEYICAQEGALSAHLKTTRGLKIRGDTRKRMWKKFPTIFFFCGIHYILFGEYAAKVDAAKILSHLPIIKAFLKERPIAPANLDLIRATMSPSNQVFENNTIGPAILTYHAWQRFCQRRPRNGNEHKSQEQFLKDSFRRAKADVELSSPARVRRLIDSGFKRAVYLYDAALNLRYVVSEEPFEHEKYPRILTVEVPMIKP